jgi:hypothetical protein
MAGVYGVSDFSGNETPELGSWMPNKGCCASLKLVLSSATEEQPLALAQRVSAGGKEDCCFAAGFGKRARRRIAYFLGRRA